MNGAMIPNFSAHPVPNPQTPLYCHKLIKTILGISHLKNLVFQYIYYQECLTDSNSPISFKMQKKYELSYSDTLHLQLFEYRLPDLMCLQDILTSPMAQSLFLYILQCFVDFTQLACMNLGLSISSSAVTR